MTEELSISPLLFAYALLTKMSRSAWRIVWVNRPVCHRIQIDFTSGQTRRSATAVFPGTIAASLFPLRSRYSSASFLRPSNAQSVPSSTQPFLETSVSDLVETMADYFRRVSRMFNGASRSNKYILVNIMQSDLSSLNSSHESSKFFC